MEDEDFLDDLEATEELAPEPQAEPVVQEPVAQPVPEPEAKPEPGFVPIGAVLDERDKRKQLEQELEALRRQNQPKPTSLPDMFEDPEGYTAAINQQFEQRLYQNTLQVSERFARQQYGDETTNQAIQWAFDRCNSDPHFNAQVQASGDPVGYAVQQFQRDQIASKVTPDDFQQFMAWKQAQSGVVAQPAPAAKPPKSLATAPSAGNVSTDPVQSDEEIFADTFARK